MTTNMEYIQNCDYLIPDLALPAEETKSLGKYGMLRKSYWCRQELCANSFAGSG